MVSSLSPLRVTASEDQAEDNGFAPLFDGKSLDGWVKVGGNAEYRVENGEIVGIGENSRPNTFLRTEKTYTDFEFRCQFKWDRPNNSGIQFRSRQKPDRQGQPNGQVFGYQFELDASKRAWSGGLFEEGRRGWLYNLKADDKAEKRQAIKLEGWNDIVIRCEGNRVRTWLNGVAITDYTDEHEQALTDGFFALQVHAGGKGTMRWRNLRIKELDKPKD